MTKIIGLVGGKGAGKTTAAEHIVRIHPGARSYAIADELKALAARIFDLAPRQLYGTQAHKEAVDPQWGVSTRALMKRTGDALRSVYGSEFQVDRLLQQISVDAPAIAVVSDVRFVNEAEALRRTGAVLWRIQYAPSVHVHVDTHASEAQWLLAKVDLEIRPMRVNPEHLCSLVDRACEMFNVC